MFCICYREIAFLIIFPIPRVCRKLLSLNLLSLPCLVVFGSLPPNPVLFNMYKNKTAILRTKSKVLGLLLVKKLIGLLLGFKVALMNTFALKHLKHPEIFDHMNFNGKYWMGSGSSQHNESWSV